MTTLTKAELQQVLAVLETLKTNTAYCMSAHEYARTHDAITLLQGKLSDTKQEPAHTDHPMRHYDRTCPACQQDEVKPVGYLAWRDGKPSWDDDCVCEDAVYPVDEYDDRTSMPIYTNPANLTRSFSRGYLKRKRND